MNKIATINDVSRMAGVSKATVSRVLNDSASVRAETREKVEMAIAALNFKPSVVARTLAMHQSDTIGLVLPNFNCAYFSTLLQQASLCCERVDKQLIVADGHNDPDKELNALLKLGERQCDALILYSRYLSDSHIHYLQTQITSPLVTINSPTRQANIPSVVFDQNGAGYMITHYLIERGHIKIGYITDISHSPNATSRLEGYKRAFIDHNYPLSPRLTIADQSSFNGGYRACQALLSRHPSLTALVVGCDEMAVGAQKALCDLGYTVPHDISIVSIDNSYLAQIAPVPITSVDIPLNEMMHSAVNAALALIEKKAASHSQFVGKIVERHSVASLR